MAETHSGSAASEPDKAGDGIPAYSSTTAYQGDNFSIYFMKNEKVLLCQRFLCVQGTVNSSEHHSRHGTGNSWEL